MYVLLFVCLTFTCSLATNSSLSMVAAYYNGILQLLPHKVKWHVSLVCTKKLTALLFAYSVICDGSLCFTYSLSACIQGRAITDSEDLTMLGVFSDFGTSTIMRKNVAAGSERFVNNCQYQPVNPFQ